MFTACAAGVVYAVNKIKKGEISDNKVPAAIAAALAVVAHVFEMPAAGIAACVAVFLTAWTLAFAALRAKRPPSGAEARWTKELP
jgi:hypothetical protein